MLAGVSERVTCYNLNTRSSLAATGMPPGDGSHLLTTAWQEAREQWLASRQDSANTMRTYALALDQFLEWSPVPPWQVSSALAREWLTWLATKGKVVGTDPRSGLVKRGPLADSTCALKLAAASSFYRFVRCEHSVPSPRHSEVRRALRVLAGKNLIFIGPDRISLWPPNRPHPFEHVERPQVAPFGGARFPSTHELRALLAAINTTTLGGKRDLALFLTLAWTCRRPSEVLGLKWGDLYPSLGGKHLYRYYSRSQQKHLWANLDNRVYDAICAYLAASDRLATIQPDDYIFVPLYPERTAHLHADAAPDPNQPLSTRTAAGILKKHARKIGLDAECAHLRGLRHAGALLRYELMKEQGAVDYAELQKVLDHGSLGVTMTYVQEVLEASAAPDDVLAAWRDLAKGRQRR